MLPCLLNEMCIACSDSIGHESYNDGITTLKICSFSYRKTDMSRFEETSFVLPIIELYAAILSGI